MNPSSSFAVQPTPLSVEGIVFPAFAAPPDFSSQHKAPFFLAGAGVRGMVIDGKFVMFTAIGVYFQDSALQELAPKWTGNTPDQLAAAQDFYSDISTSQFEKFLHLTMILPLTGEQYSGKVAEMCTARLKQLGMLTKAEVDAINQFQQLFRPETFLPGHSMLFTISPSGTLSIAFSKDDSVPETNKAVIESKALCWSIMYCIIGENTIFPAAKRSMADRICEHLNSQSTN